jgi:L-rhamnose mutarotase
MAAGYSYSFSSKPQAVAWLEYYRQHRYGRYLKQDELNWRFRDVLFNLLTLTADGKIGVLAKEASAGRWWELMTHVQEEFAIRHGPFPAGFTKDILQAAPYPDFAGPLAAKAASAFASRPPYPNPVLVRHGSPQFMSDLYERGQIRVRNASYYKTPDHNGAVRDDELRLHVSLAPDRESMLKVVKDPQDMPVDYNGQRLDFRFDHQRDFWLYCLTSSLEPRLFVDFDATACVVIKDPGEFGRRLRAGGAKYFPGSDSQDGPVNYVDPLLPRTAKPFVPMCKHFRYEYQREHRFIWSPPPATGAISFVDVTLGPLTDIADLVIL